MSDRARPERLGAKGKLPLGKCAGLPWGAGPFPMHTPVQPVSVTSRGSCAPGQAVTAAGFLAAGTAGEPPALGPGRSARAPLSLSSPSSPWNRGVCAPCLAPFHSHGIPWLQPSVSRAHATFLGFLPFDDDQQSRPEHSGEIILQTNCWVGGQVYE